MITSSKEMNPEILNKTLTAKLFHNLCQVDLQRSAWHPPFSGEKKSKDNKNSDPGQGMSKLPLSAAVLKWIALVTMITDHIGASFLKYYFAANGRYEPFSTAYEVFRDIGRVAFPIYIFLLIEGYTRTRNVSRYLLRMGLFALLSEVPFDLAFYDKAMYLNKQNVFFTLFIGLITIHAMDSIASEGGIESARGGAAKQKHLPRLYFVFCDIGLIALAAAVAFFLKTDYGYVGICAICAVYLLRRYPILAGVLCVVILLRSSPREIYAAAAIIPLSLYNGKRGRQLKYFFYLAYPVHLFILWLIRFPLGI